MTITSAVTMASSIHRYSPNARLASLGLGMGEGEEGELGMLLQGSWVWFADSISSRARWAS